MNERKKISKIANEVILFLLKKGYNDLDINIKYGETSELSFKIKNFEKRHLDYMDKIINVERSFIAEDYGWELLGESSDTNELYILGLITDGMHSEIIDDCTKITIVRKQI